MPNLKRTDMIIYNLALPLSGRSAFIDVVDFHMISKPASGNDSAYTRISNAPPKLTWRIICSGKRIRNAVRKNNGLSFHRLVAAYQINARNARSSVVLSGAFI
jgi:hypothetical protein